MTDTPDELSPHSLERAHRFALWALLHLLGSAPEIDVAFNDRADREAARGKQSGRTQEIQRLIGRSLRAVVDLQALGERQITLDCDVIQADGGTRTAAISGAWVALRIAIDKTAGPEEREAWGWLLEAIERHRKGGPPGAGGGRGGSAAATTGGLAMNDLEFDASDGLVCKHEAAQFGGIDDQRAAAGLHRIGRSSRFVLPTLGGRGTPLAVDVASSHSGSMSWVARL